MEHIEITDKIWAYPNAIEKYKELEDIINNEIDKTITKEFLEGFSCYGSLVFFPEGGEHEGPLSNIFANLFSKFEEDYVIRNNISAHTHGPFSVIYHEPGSWYQTKDVMPESSIRFLYVLKNQSIGGEFYFPELNLTLELEENTMYVFPETINSGYYITADPLAEGTRTFIKTVIH